MARFPAAAAPASSGPGPVEVGLGDQRGLRDAFGAFVTGVTVLTVGVPAPHGMTANSFTTVSLDPPLVLVCVARTATMHARLAAADRFAVSVLGEEQDWIARYFAGPDRPAGAAQFSAVGWRPGPRSGVPVIDGALAWFECTVRRRDDGGDHTVVLGELIGVHHRPGEGALLFQHGRLRPAAGRQERSS